MNDGTRALPRRHWYPDVARRRPARCRPVQPGRAGRHPRRAGRGIVWDWEAWWALELEWRPSIDLSYLDRLSAYYECAWRAHRTVDETDAVHPGGYPGALRDLLGLSVKEFLPLWAGSAVRLDGDLTEAGPLPRAGVPGGVELVRWVGDSASYLIAIDHTDRDAELAATGKELLPVPRATGRQRYPPETSACCAPPPERGPTRIQNVRGSREDTGYGNS